MADQEIVKIETEYRLGIIPARTPHDVIVQATEIAKELAKIVKENRMSLTLQGKEYVKVEGWSTMGAMLGVLPREVTELTRRFEDGSYEATVELIRITDGAVIGRGSALVGMDEKDRFGKLTWGSRNEFARRSMAITRATGKAYRLGFSWIMGLAGYMPTPAEEMETVEGEIVEVGEAPGNGSNPEKAETPKKKAPPSLPQRLVEAGLVDNVPHASGILNKLAIKGKSDEDITQMVKTYIAFKDAGNTSEEAAQKVNAGEQL